MESLESLYGPAISVYTRDQAIEDGVLVPVLDYVRYGFTRPVCLTRALFDACDGEQLKAHVTAVLDAFCASARTCSGDMLTFTASVAGEDKALFAVADADGLTVGFPEDF